VNRNLWEHEEEVKLTEYLVARICSKASGQCEDECLRNYPRDVYFIGNIRPKEEEPEDAKGKPTYFRELINKLAPVAFGAEFRLRPTDGKQLTVAVKVQWSSYYRIFPTFEQQRKHQLLDKESDNKSHNGSAIEEPVGKSETCDIDTDTDSLTQTNELDNTVASPEANLTILDRRQERSPQDSLFIRFRKVSCCAEGYVIIRQDEVGKWEVDTTELQRALDDEATRAQRCAIQDPDRVRVKGATNTYIQVPKAALASENEYNAFLKSLRIDVVPQWRLEVRHELRQAHAPSTIVMLLEFVNTSSMPVASPNTEAFMFDTRATFIFPNGSVLPFELTLAPRGFRYDRNLWGRGFNCAVELVSMEPPTFTTTHVPVYRQMRYVTRTDPKAPFDKLSTNPVPILESILTSMKDYKRIWDDKRQEYLRSDPHWEQTFGEEYNTDRQQFEAEISLFEKGLELIKTDQDVLHAFKLTNETFLRGGKTEWRLFQIVFLVGQIPGIVALREDHSSYAYERDKVDIIYFPTGGGKTEAYLGVLVFHCFFDRLRGKSAGVTAWIRFPLRLLTLQQTQRVADIICIAELVRREQEDPRLAGESVDGFAVGYFVGAEATPNEITPPYQEGLYDAVWSQANDDNARQLWKRIVRCPACRTTSVRVDFDQDTVRIIHRCTNDNCPFEDGVIPVYVVDNEIYRYLPSVIVGTIDKLAGIGNQRKLCQVFGQVDGYCKKHGYYKKRCCQKECRERIRLVSQVPAGLSGPTLFVQDELHLLKEGLGTFDAHYETFVQRIRQEFGEHESLKIIASSATIEAFERQVEHLYGRDRANARIFPSVGPALGQSFYSTTLDYPQRLFVGIIPHNKTIFNTILELIEYYHREISHLQSLSSGHSNPYGGTLLPGTSEYRSLLDLYATSLTYFLANRELNSVRTDLEGDVNPNLMRDGFRALVIEELTGSTRTDEVTRILDLLERPAKPGTSPDTVLATSMISHGVDVDRLNAMIFYGMPRLNAEYIQASSRVGRRHVGIVFTCLHPARERDQSHYAYFVKYHEFLGQLVEPVAINRWSRFSVNRTLPGLFMSILLQIVANTSRESNPNRYYMLDFVKRQIAEGNLRVEQFVPLLEEAYLVQGGNKTEEVSFREEIHRRVKQFFDQIIGASSGTFVSEVLIPRPMRSLRDIDEPIEIELDSSGTQWAIRTVQN